MRAITSPITLLLYPSGRRCIVHRLIHKGRISYSKKVSVPTENVQEKEKLKNYLYNIPPWMKKNNIVKAEDIIENKNQLSTKANTDKPKLNSDHEINKNINKFQRIKYYQEENKKLPRINDTSKKNQHMNNNNNNNNNNTTKVKDNNEDKMQLVTQVDNDKLELNKSMNNKLKGKASNSISEDVNKKNKPNINEDSATSILVRKEKLESLLNKTAMINVLPNRLEQLKLTELISNKNDVKCSQKAMSQQKIIINSTNEMKMPIKISKKPAITTVNKNLSSLKNLSRIKQDQLSELKQMFKQNKESASNFTENIDGKAKTDQTIVNSNLNDKISINLKSIDITHSGKLKDKRIEIKENETIKQNLNTPNMAIINPLGGIKVNDILSQDITWAKQKINSIKKKEFEKLFLNKTKKETDKGTILDNTEIKNVDKTFLTDKFTDKEILKSNVNQNEKTTRKTDLKRKEDHVVLKLISNPIKLNSKELLYTNQENKQNHLPEMKINEELKLKQRLIIKKNFTNLQNRLNSVKKNQNKLKEITNNNNKQSYNNLKGQKNDIIDNRNMYKKNNNLGRPVKTSIKYKNAKGQIFSHNKEKTVKTEQKPVIISKPKTNTNTTIKPTIVNMVKSENRQQNLEKRTVINVNKKNQYDLQNEWYNNNKKSILPKPKQDLKRSINKKPIFISKKLTMKLHHLKLQQSPEINVLKKKLRPVFAPPLCSYNTSQQNVASAASSSSNSNNNNQSNNDDGDDGRNKNDDDRTVCCHANNDNNSNTDKQLPPINSHKLQNNYNCSNKTNVNQLKEKLIKIIDNFRKLIINAYEKSKDYFSNEISVDINKPSENLNISLLKTNNEKQPIYICDKCSYLFKKPNIYEKLHKKLITFSHLIKTSDEDMKNFKRCNIDKNFGESKQMETNSSNTCDICTSNLKTDCIKSRKKLNIFDRKIQNNNNCTCPKSYSEILTNLLASHLRQRN